MMKMWDVFKAAARAAIAGVGLSTAHAGALDDIKARGELVVGMEVAYAPYEFKKDGEIVGYDVDIGKRFAEKLGVKPVFLDTEWSGVIPSLYAKKFDLIISGMTITGERAKKVAFSMPYADATNTILVRADDTSINSAADLSGKIVGSQLSSAADTVAKKFDEKLKASGKPGFADYKLYGHFPEAYVDLSNKRIDAVVNSLSPLLMLVAEQKGKYRVVEGVQDIKAYFGMAIRQDDKDLLAFVDGELKSMKDSGDLAKLQVKWFGASMSTPDAVPDALP